MTVIFVGFYPGALPLAVEFYPFGIKKYPIWVVVESISHAGWGKALEKRFFGGDRTLDLTPPLLSLFRVFGGMAPSGDALPPRKHENRRKLKRPVSQNPGIYEETEPKAFPSHTRAPAR